jgi:1-acyl-sn-glycerol-3-phosphate acyltransferase
MKDRRSLLARLGDRLRQTGPELGRDPTVFRPEAIERTLERSARWIGPDRYLDARATGWANIPDEPVLLVGNHSGGTSVPDMWSLLTTWYLHYGTERPLYVLGHELLFATDRLARYMAERGILRAGRQSAENVIAHGGDVLIAPGGERDVWRPWSQRWEVEMAGRTGYARLALESNRPIIPVAGAGAHHTLVVLTDGRKLAQALGLPRAARAEVWPIHISAPWGLALGPLPHIPVPRRVHFRFAPPITPDAPSGPDDPEAVEALDRAVRTALQDELSALQASWTDNRRGIRQTVRHVVRPR